MLKLFLVVAITAVAECCYVAIEIWPQFFILWPFFLTLNVGLVKIALRDMTKLTDCIARLTLQMSNYKEAFLQKWKIYFQTYKTRDTRNTGYETHPEV